jgi:NADH:ubiquinone oxidoreductase subunit 2 (subunit N)
MQLSSGRFYQAFINYCSTGYILTFFIMQLSGIPPVFLFVLKFNFLLSLVKIYDFITIVVIVLNVVVSVYFYLQFIGIKTAKLNNRLLNQLIKVDVKGRNFLFFRNIDYTRLYGIVIFWFFTFFGFLFFFYVFVIVSAIIF